MKTALNDSHTHTKLPSVLTIQSHVAYGHVGNCAATFPMQLLKVKPIVINTVQFSNHTGYGEFKGQVFSASHIEDILDGLEARGVLNECEAVLSGYLGDAAIGDVILNAVKKIRQNHPKMIYLCDPVMGDVGRGIFVRPGIPEFLKNQAINQATIITPNHFEFELLTDKSFDTIEAVIDSARQLIQNSQFLEAIVITSLKLPELPEDKLETLVVTADKAYLVETPYHQLNPLPNGMGDTFSAILLSHLLNKMPIPQALESAVSSLYALVSHTKDKERDLPLIAHQADIVNPTTMFNIHAI